MDTKSTTPAPLQPCQLPNRRTAKLPNCRSKVPLKASTLEESSPGQNPRMAQKESLDAWSCTIEAVNAKGPKNLSEVVILIPNGRVLRFLELSLVLRDERHVDLDLRRLGKLANELEVGLVREAAGEPEEGLLEVVVAAGTEVIVLKVALPVELDVLGLHLPILHIDLVANQHNGNVLADADNVAVPVRNILVGNSRGHVEHDYSALALDVVTVAETSKLLLACCIPHVEAQVTAVCGELQGMDLHAQSGDVLLLELTRQVPLHQCGLANATVTNEHQLELWDGHCS
mmetsp:Transcript_23056/g.50949  ORF Transcript_23056/g.50949 Transcript_23056/m.50949 type:complete len:287 (+) Transcript_23056:194-1054(+)